MANNNPHQGDGGADTAQKPALGSQVADQTTAYDPSQISAMDQKIASDYGIPISQLSPELISQYSQEVAARSGGTWGQTVMPLLGDAAWAGVTGGIGAELAPAIAGATGLGAVGSGALSGAAVGAGSGALRAYGTGQNIGEDALTGGALGAVGGALSGGIGQQASTAVGNATGLGPVASSAIARGALGAGVGALGGEITGGNVGDDALLGGASGAASGAVGAATGSPTLGGISGTIAGLGASTLLKPSVPTAVTGAPPTTASSLSALPTDPNAGTTNIGSYSGYGYAPRQQVQNPVSDYATYGQGPEASFFQPAGTQPSAQPGPPAVSNSQPVPISIPTLRQ